MEATLGARHPLLAKSYNNMGGLMFRIRDFAEARKCYLRALEIWEADVKANEEQVAPPLSMLCPQGSGSVLHVICCRHQ